MPERHACDPQFAPDYAAYVCSCGLLWGSRDAFDAGLPHIGTTNLDRRCGALAAPAVGSRGICIRTSSHLGFHRSVNGIEWVVRAESRVPTGGPDGA
jgi:hypothetical protein